MNFFRNGSVPTLTRGSDNHSDELIDGIVVTGRGAYFRLVLLLSVTLGIAVAVSRLVMLYEPFYNRAVGNFDTNGSKGALYAIVLLSMLAIIGISSVAGHMLCREFSSLDTVGEDGSKIEAEGDIGVSFERLDILSAPTARGVLMRICSALLALTFALYPVVYLLYKAVHGADGMRRFTGTTQFFACLFALLGASLFAVEILLPFFENRKEYKRRKTVFAILFGVLAVCAAAYFVCQMISLNLYIAEPLLRSPTRYFIIFACSSQVLFFVQEAKVRIGGNRIMRPAIWTFTAAAAVFLGLVDSLPSLLGGVDAGGPAAMFHLTELAAAVYAAGRLWSARSRCVLSDKTPEAQTANAEILEARDAATSEQDDATSSEYEPE